VRVIRERLALRVEKFVAQVAFHGGKALVRGCGLKNLHNRGRYCGGAVAASDDGKFAHTVVSKDDRAALH
jgi:hypothetical protein